MKNLRVHLASCLLAAGLVACGESPRAITAADAHRTNNGSGFGSGHRTDSDSTTASTAEATADSELTDGRGGSGLGSGH